MHEPADSGLIVLATSDGALIAVRDGDVVGRSAVGREVLDAREGISRRHVQFILSECRWYVVDLGSRNGTYVEGHRIAPRSMVPVLDGQSVKLSPTFEVTVRIEGCGKGGGLSEAAAPGGVQGEISRMTMVVLFADLKGSVDFFQEQGTIIARNWIMNLYRMLEATISAHNGKHVKNIGDAILAVFGDAREAVLSARDMQLAINAHNAKVDKAERYHLRIGMNMGSVIMEKDDVFGNAVNIASRVQSLAPPGGILITEALHTAIGDDKGIPLRRVGHEQLKGVKETICLYEVLIGSTTPSEQADLGGTHTVQ